MSVNKFNKMAIVIIIIFGLLVAIMNIYLYNLGSEFAEEHNATEWRVEFTESFRGLHSSSASGIAWSSYYKYLDENGRDLVLSERLYVPYNALNLEVYNIVETYGIVSLIVVILGIVGVFMNIAKRYNYSGYLFVILAGMFGAIQQGIMNYFSLLIPISSVIAVILISKSGFVDWNGSLLFTFTKIKK